MAPVNLFIDLVATLLHQAIGAQIGNPAASVFGFSRFLPFPSALGQPITALYFLF
jgi:hypothetical protein